MRPPANFVLVGLLAAASLAGAAPRLGGFKTSSNNLERLDVFNVSFQVQGSAFKNPFDPAEIDIKARFRSPSGRQVEVDAFFDQDFTRSGPPEALVAGAKHWRVHFSPDEAGAWSWSLICHDTKAGDAQAGPYRLQVLPSRRKAWPQPSAKDSAYLSFEDGTPFVPIGQNLGWGDWGMRDGTYAFDRWLPKIAAQGGNYARVWMWSDAHGIEWKDTGLGDYRARLNQAWRLDYVLEAARKNGVQVMLMLMDHGSVSNVSNANWKNSPYNRLNGGPCEKPLDFFTDARAQAFFKRRLRYIAARWGWQPNLIFELANEIDNTDEYIKSPEVSQAVASWHRQMADYLHSVAPKPMLTTSFSRFQSGEDVRDMAEFGLAQIHLYSASPGASDLQSDILRSYRAKRPSQAVFGGEMGYNDGPLSVEKDPNGVHWHSGQWASLMSGACGPSALWWWADYIEPRNLYTLYRGLAGYLAGMDLSSAQLKPVDAVVESAQRGDLIVTPYGEWGYRAPSSHFELSPAGQLSPGSDQFAGFLYDQKWNAALRNPPTFKINFPQTTRLVVRSNKPSGQPKLEINLDGQVIYSALQKDAGNATVDIPAGFHRLGLDNTGTGWVDLDSLRFQAAVPALKAYVLQGPDLILAWIAHRDHNPERVKQGPIISAATGTLVLKNARDGRWQAEWWDSLKGVAESRSEARATGGVLKVSVPATNSDRALKLRFVGP